MPGPFSRVLMSMAVVLAVAAPTAAADPKGAPYVGKSSAGSVTFTITSNGRFVRGFRFVNRCVSASIRGNLVHAKMEIVDGAFAYTDRDGQFEIAGRYLSDGSMVGTARNTTGDCDSGVLQWKARDSVYYTDLNGRPAQTPTRIDVVANGGYWFHQLRWKQWGQRTTTATGKQAVVTCLGCTSGEFVNYDIKIKLSKPQFCADTQARTYRRMKIIHVGERPEGTNRTATIRILCLDR